MRKLIIFAMAIGMILLISACNGNSPYSSVQIGEIIQLGGYDWRVLEVADGMALVLSEKILTKMSYHPSETAITWSESDLRQYLNGDFYDNTFSEEEKAWIAKKSNVNDDNQWYGTDGGDTTVDKVFLLSVEEVVKYFGDSGQLKNRPTRTANSINDEYNSLRVAESVDTGTPSWWWLRSPGCDKQYAVVVDMNGQIYLYSFVYVSSIGGVRPALWLKL